jgi:hypothetical protein
MGGIRYLNIMGLEKIYFPLDPTEGHEYSSESVWAKKIGDGKYKIMNIPFYVKGTGLYDIVNASMANHALNFKSTIERSGHSVYRIILNNFINEELFNKYWKPLEKEGCAFEKATDRFYAIDVPPSSDIYMACNLLEKGEHDSIWEFDEGYCGHPLKD